MLEDVEGHPLPAQISGRPHRLNPHRTGTAPHIGRVCHGPAFHSHTARELFPTRLIHADQIDEGLMKLCEIAGLSQPVIHLDIDVEVVVRGPWWLFISIPNTLQVRRKAARTRRGDQEIAAELVVGFHEIGVVMAALLQALEAVFVWFCEEFVTRLTNVKLDAIVVFLMIGNGVRLDLAKRLGLELLECAGCLGLPSLGEGCGRILAMEIRADGELEGQLADLLKFESAGIRRYIRRREGRPKTILKFRAEGSVRLPVQNQIAALDLSPVHGSHDINGFVRSNGDDDDIIRGRYKHLLGDGRIIAQRKSRG